MTTLISLESRVRRRIGDRKEGAYRWQSDELLNLVEDAVGEHNSENPPQLFEVTGTGDARAFNPTPSSDDLRLLMLYVELLAAQSEKKSAMDFAVKRTSPLGSFDGTKVSEHKSFDVGKIRREIAQHKRSKGRAASGDGMGARAISISEPDRITE